MLEDSYMGCILVGALLSVETQVLENVQFNGCSDDECVVH